MKLVPTDLDREAARLFNAVPRMRAWFAEPGADARACTVLDVSTLPGEWDPGKPRRWVAWEGCNGACGWVRAEWLTALDTDDGPTQGAMLAQVESAAGADCAVTHGTMVEPAGELKWKVRMAKGFDLHVLGNVFGPTRGAALVAAKRALAAAETA